MDPIDLLKHCFQLVVHNFLVGDKEMLDQLGCLPILALGLQSFDLVKQVMFVFHLQNPQQNYRALQIPQLLPRVPQSGQNQPFDCPELLHCQGLQLQLALQEATPQVPHQIYLNTVVPEALDFPNILVDAYLQQKLTLPNLVSRLHCPQLLSGGPQSGVVLQGNIVCPNGEPLLGPVGLCDVGQLVQFAPSQILVGVVDPEGTWDIHELPEP